MTRHDATQKQGKHTTLAIFHDLEAILAQLGHVTCQKRRQSDPQNALPGHKGLSELRQGQVSDSSAKQARSRESSAWEAHWHGKQPFAGPA